MKRHLAFAFVLALVAGPSWSEPIDDLAAKPPVARIDAAFRSIRAQIVNAQSKMRRGVGDVGNPTSESLQKPGSAPVGSLLSRCCSANVQKIGERVGLITVTSEELTAQFKREGNTDGLDALKTLNAGLKALGIGLEDVGRASTRDFAEQEMSKVRLAMDEVTKGVEALKACCADAE